MPQADTSRSQVYYAAETTWGVTPTGPAPTLKPIRFTGESLAHAKNTVESAEIRADSQVTDYAEVGASAEGDVNVELSYGAFDDLIEAELRGTWAVVHNTTLTLNFTIAGGGNGGTMAGTGVDTGVVPGLWVRLNGSVNNDGYYLVLSVVSGTITVDASTPILNAGTADAGCTIDGDYVRNGTTKRSFTLEKVFSDLSSGHYIAFPGMRINNFNLTFQADQILTGVMSFMGKEGLSSSATVGNGTPAAAAAGEVMNATSNVGTIFEGGATLTTALQSVAMNITNTLRSQRAIGSRGAIGIGYGRFRVSGNINAYFENGSLYAKMIAHTSSSLCLRVHEDGSTAGKLTSATYLFYMPRIKFGAGNPVAPATDQDVFISLDYMALRDPTLSCTLQAQRYPKIP